VAVSQETISKLKALSVSDVLQRDGTYLKKVGREFVTHCIWHDDRNPSLTVSDDKGFVFCHVCQHHDDAIGFISQKYGINFAQACEKVAASAGIDVQHTNEDPEQAAKNKAIRQKAFDDVTDKQIGYRKSLRDYPESIAFIQSRNIEPEASREFGIGYDHISKRLTLPISNHLGNFVGFTARTILPDVKPKYKNTENNLIFNKSDIVFNEYRAAQHIRSLDECVFVEGHLDVVSMWQGGIKNVVALQGTASPSEGVLRRLLRKTKRFVLCMDSDPGGITAISKFLNAVKDYTLKGELDVRVAVLPDGMDPDDYIQSGNSISSVISNAQSWLDWTLDQWLSTLDFSDELKIQEVEKKIKDLFSQISSPALRSYYYDKASIRLAQNKQSLAAQIAKGFHEFKGTTVHIKGWQRPSFKFTRELVEKRLLRLYIHSPEFRWLLAPLMENLHFPQMKWLWRRLGEVQSIAGDGFDHHAVLAVLCAAEPIYMQTLRPIVSPSIKVEDNELSIAHIESVMTMPVKDYLGGYDEE
jgi:DNA primase